MAKSPRQKITEQLAEVNLKVIPILYENIPQGLVLEQVDIGAVLHSGGNNLVQHTGPVALCFGGVDAGSALLVISSEFAT